MKPWIKGAFWSKVLIRLEEDCWVWKGGKNSKGYGHFPTAYRHGISSSPKAHRVAYILAVGPIPDGLLVCHHCDNPSCCNPKHLFLGTYQDNMQDCVSKGRWKGGRKQK